MSQNEAHDGRRAIDLGDHDEDPGGTAGPTRCVSPPTVRATGNGVE